MSVYSFDEHFNLIQVVNAEKAEFTAQGWNMLNGTVTVFSDSHLFPLTRSFKEKKMIIAETPKDFQEIDKEVEGLKFRELYRYIQRIKSAGADTKSYEVKLHSRMSLGFIPLVMCLLAVPFSVRTRRGGGLAKDFGFCLVLTFFYWLFYSFGLSFGINGVLPPGVAAWSPSWIFLILALILNWRKRA
jgi:lipopolysaccharide export system permease protein